MNFLETHQKPKATPDYYGVFWDWQEVVAPTLHKTLHASAAPDSCQKAWLLQRR